MSESIIEKALLEAEQLEETMKSNEQEDTEQEVDMPMDMDDMDLGMELDIEDETDDIDMLSDELPPLDLTLASDEEVLKVFKAMGSEDGIIVQQDNDEISLTDGDDEYLIKLEEQKKSMKKRNLKEMKHDHMEGEHEEPMYEIEMDAEDEPMYEIELDEMEGGHSHDGDVMGVDAPESEDGLEDYDEDMMEMDEPMYEIELDEEGEHNHDDRYDMKQGYNDRLDDSLGADNGAERNMKQSLASRRKESEGMEKAIGRNKFTSNQQSNQGEMGEASRTLGFGSKSGRGLRKGFTNNRNLDLNESARTKGRKLQENYHLLQEEVKNLKGRNGEYRKALVSFKQKLNEVGMFNSNLAYATRLFTEHSTTKQEKVNILRRFDNVMSLKESKDLYRVVREELSQNKPSITNKTKKSISESVDRKINSTPRSGSNIKLMETKAYENPQFSRIKDLMSKL